MSVLNVAQGIPNLIGNIMATAEANIRSQMREDDYIDPTDGFIHCGKCRKPRQTKISIFGMEQTVFCICDCRIAEMKKQEEEQIRHKVEIMRKDGFYDAALAESTFEHDEFPDNINSKIARNYVEHFQHFYEEGKGLLMTGGVGTGKTFYASCIANALIEKLHPVLVTSIGRYIRGMEEDYESRNEKIEYLQKFALVVFDDFGVERNTPYVNELIYAIIDGRIRSGKPMIVTTNIDLPTLANSDNIDMTRIYDRLIAGCIPVKFEGQNIRRAKARSDYRDDMALLKGDLLEN